MFGNARLVLKAITKPSLAKHVTNIFEFFKMLKDELLDDLNDIDEELLAKFGDEELSEEEQKKLIEELTFKILELIQKSKIAEKGDKKILALVIGKKRKVAVKITFEVIE